MGFSPDHFRCGFFARKPRPDEQQPLTEEEKAAAASASAGNAAPGEPTQEELMNLQEPMEMD